MPLLFLRLLQDRLCGIFECRVNILIKNIITDELNTKTDEELAVLAKTSRKAAAVLASRYAELILIKSEIYASAAADSEDLRQEGQMSLLRAVGSFDPNRGVKFSTFAGVCIDNRMRTVTAKARRAAPVTGDGLDTDELASDEADPERIYLDKEYFSELRRGIREVLSLAELRAFSLCVQGMSYRRAAETLGVSEKAVDNAMQRARRKIRALIGAA